jgi:predicted 2-oxoglutarate/Fe(II)-dependent dioxygenase YbiX
MRSEKFEDAIVEINGVTNPQFLKLLIDYADKKCTAPLQTFENAPEWYRRVCGHTLTNTSISDTAHFLNIQNEIMKGYSHYKFKFPQTTIAKVLQIDLLKYTEGGGYFYHTDDSNHGRTLSVIFNLNDEYEGGELVFGHQNLKEEFKRIKMKSGTMCFFPSNFLYPHKIEKITKGKRYSVVAWLG